MCPLHRKTGPRVLLFFCLRATVSHTRTICNMWQELVLGQDGGASMPKGIAAPHFCAVTAV